MKKIGLLILMLISTSVFGQNLAECGIDNNPNLTKTESEFLNQYMDEEQRKGFDFTNKKILFVTGPDASSIGTKKEYFDSIKEWNENGHKIVTWIVDLDKKEQIESNYNVIITYWVKAFTKKRKMKILKEIKASR